MNRLRTDAHRIFDAALRAVDPGRAVHRFMTKRGEMLSVGERRYDLGTVGHVFVVGAGKAGASMARAVEEILGDRITSGLVVVKYGYVAELGRIELREAGHPIPDQTGERAAEALLAIARGAGEHDLVIVLLSGGGSALLPLPVGAVTLEEKQAATSMLLRSGATINEMNAIRKHISRIKGGRLAEAAAPAPVVTLILSDVIRDRLDVIASGPTVADESTFGECLTIISRYGLGEELPASVLAHLSKGAAGTVAETPKPGNSIFEGANNIVVGNNRDALGAAKLEAESLGYRAHILSSTVEGETRDVARDHVAIVNRIRKSGTPVSSPCCLISGGETTVTVRGRGMGGRNQEFALAAAIELDGVGGVVVLSAGTDGTDGPTEAAGAIADGRTVRRAREQGIDAARALEENDSHTFFSALGDLVVTGPTNTNVMDIHLLLVQEEG
ncbi:hypothetical protein AMJ39_06975 [candidate division TA06 bacterium DG_24]|uniref:Glycerate kinase n=1 Tax=candidate division TA06 bacterium DG_24 TaxID=1703770 RepID=A0A0S7WRD2_UNCT6|nr:MAG: hypothetical protein AMJ39_06975 [candidate division TA06 bacterium DG_24]